MDSNHVEASNFFLGVLCKSLSCFITARITFTSKLFLSADCWKVSTSWWWRGYLPGRITRWFFLDAAWLNSDFLWTLPTGAQQVRNLGRKTTIHLWVTAKFNFLQQWSLPERPPLVSDHLSQTSRMVAYGTFHSTNIQLSITRLVN